MTAEQVIDEKTEEGIVGGEDVALPGGRETVGALAGAFGQGRVVARTAAQLTGELAKIAVGRSAVAPVKGDRRCRTRHGTPTRSTAGSSRRIWRRRARWVGSWTNGDVRPRIRTCAARIVRRRDRDQRRGADQLPADQPCRAQGGLRHRWYEPGPRGRPLPVGRAPQRGHALDGRTGRRSPWAPISRSRPARWSPATKSPNCCSTRRRPTPCASVRCWWCRRRSVASTSWICGRDAASSSTRCLRGLQMHMLSWRNPQQDQAEWNLDTYASRVSSSDRRGMRDHRQRVREPHRVLRGRHHHHHVAQPSCLERRFPRAQYVLRGYHARLRPTRTTSGVLRAAGAPVREGTLAAQGADQRPRHGLRFHLAASRRPRLQLRGEQLPDGPQTAGVRHPRLERRRHQPSRGATRAVPRHLRRQPVGRAERVRGTRHPDQPPANQGAHLRLRCDRRSPDHMEELLPHHPIAGRGIHVRAQLLRAHRQPGESSRQPQGALLDRRRTRSDPKAWLAGATRKTGSWWEPWADWASEMAGEERPAAKDLGSDNHKPLDPAPGRYVRDLV